MKNLYLLLISTSANKIISIFKVLFIIGLLSLSSQLPAQEVADNCNFLNKIGGIASTNGAEISTYDPVSKRVYTVAGPVVEYYTLNNSWRPYFTGNIKTGL